MTHKFWGTIKEDDWAEFTSDITFSHPFFNEQNIEIFLGDEDGEEIEDFPTEQQLTEFAETYQMFIEDIESKLQSIQNKAFERYLELYAHFYENPDKSGKPALNIDSVEKHNDAIKDMTALRVSGGKTLRLSIRYLLDTEHGLEFKFVDNQLVKMAGIAET